MKQILAVLFLCAALLLGPGNVPADECGQWNQDGACAGKKEADESATPARSLPTTGETERPGGRDRRSCSMAEEPELLALLRELEELKTAPEKTMRPGSGESVVRKKYRIARRLRKFDDCRAEDALRELIRENACEDLGEGDIFCVRWGAEASLQEVSSKKDLKKLSAGPPTDELLKLVKKYGPHPHKNEFASHEVMNYLIEQADSRPTIYVPMLIEYFTRCHEVLPIARQYPAATDIGLKRCFASHNPATVWAGISLARSLAKKQFLGRVFDVAFADRGNIDYSRQAEVDVIRTMALGFFRMFEKDALPYYRAILYGDYGREKEYIISGIRNPHNPDLLALLKDYDRYLAANPDRADAALVTRLRNRITAMERTGR